MRTLLITLFAATAFTAARAQEPVAPMTGSTPAAVCTPAMEVPYAYCQIIGSPHQTTNTVAFDFGQPTAIWSSEALKDPNGDPYQFNSVIEALNFMTRQGWEFVQAYSTGEESVKIHYLLRMPVSKLTDQERLHWSKDPQTRKQMKNQK